MPYKPTDDDKKLWEHTVKGAKKLRKPSQPPPASSLSKTSGSLRVQDVTSPSRTAKNKSASPASPPMPPDPPQLNRRNEMRLRQGKIKIEATIDLHGLSRERAFSSLKSFVLNAYSSEKRCVLVITGKGKISSPSVIKQSLPDWLAAPEIAPLILRVLPAQPKDGGGGAFYVYLKKRKTG